MRRRLGQHFLRNPSVARTIAAAVDPAPGETVIEVGPGHGELTQALAARAARAEAATNSGGSKDVRPVRIIAVEKDPLLAEKTRLRFKDDASVEVVGADIMEFLAGPAGAAVMERGYKIVGNIPYYLTGYLLRIISELERKPDSAVFMVQKEVAERAVSRPPRMNRLAAALGFWAEPKIVLNVGRKEFDPPPEVDSAVLMLRTIDRKMEVSPKSFYKAVRVLFAQPRKTVLNNLKEGLQSKKAGGVAESILEACDIAPGARPQDLDITSITCVALEVDKTGDGWG